MLLKKGIVFVFSIFLGFSLYISTNNNNIVSASEYSPEPVIPNTVEYEGVTYYLNNVVKDDTKYSVQLATPGRIVNAKKRSEVMYTRRNSTSPWTFASENVSAWTEFTYWTGYDSYYEITKVDYYGPSDSQSQPKVLKFEYRTYHYRGY